MAAALSAWRAFVSRDWLGQISRTSFPPAPKHGVSRLVDVTLHVSRAMRKVAAAPEGAATRDRSQLLPGVRSLHLGQMQIEHTEARVRRPIHIVYYRVIKAGLVEIVRVL